MKKFVSLLMTLMLMFGMFSVLSACSNGDDTVTVVSPYSESDAEVEEDSDLLPLEEDPESVELNGFYLLKNDKYYSLNGKVQNDADIGIRTKSYNKVLYSNLVFYNKCNSWTFHSFDEVPEPTLSNGDKVISFSNNTTPTLYLYKIGFYGYGLCVSYYPNNNLAFSSPGNGIYDIYENVSNFSVKEHETGKVVDDYYDLTPNMRYVVSWYDEANYLEEDACWPRSSVYTFLSKCDESMSPYQNYDYEIEGSSTDFGSIEYDLSDVEPGLYKLASSDDVIYENGWMGVINVE